MSDPHCSPHAAPAVVIGAGPAGLMAAEIIASQGIAVDVYDAMPSVARKLLIAGVGGLNLTHSEPLDGFIARYQEHASEVAPWIRQFDPDALRAWAAGLGIETFVGSSGRVFPRDMKAAPLLRSWLRRLRQLGVRIHLRHRWLGFSGTNGLCLEAAGEKFERNTGALVLALGGGSWSRLGADARWLEVFTAAGIPVTPLQASNCGFDVDWSAHFRERFAGAAVKPVRARIAAASTAADAPWLQGEFVISADGVEGSLIYAFSAALRRQLATTGEAILQLDLAPGRDQTRLQADLSKPRSGRTLSEHLRRNAGIDGVKAGLLHESGARQMQGDPAALAQRIKCLPVVLLRARPLDEAISTAGGVCLDALDSGLMLQQRPGVFCAGEMLDWDAPTGGYLLTACLASGRLAGQSAVAWLRTHRDAHCFENAQQLANSSPTNKTEAL